MNAGHTKRGFTVVEMMVAVVSSAVLVLIASAVLFMTFRSWRVNNAYASLRRDAAFAVEMMSRDIREARDAPPANAVDRLVISNAVRNYTATYLRNSTNGVVSCTRTGGFSIPIVARGVGSFSAEPQTNAAGVVDGILLSIIMQNNDLGIAVTHETFVNMRNRTR